MTTVSMHFKEDNIKRKLDEADKAMDCVIMCLSGVGVVGKKHIALFIKEVKGDGKNDPSGVQ